MNIPTFRISAAGAEAGTGAGPSALASTFARQIYDKPKMRVALFVGNDITANLIANQVVKMMSAEGLRPAIYLPKHRPSNKSEAKQFLVRELSLYERDIPNEVIYPLLESEPLQLNAEALSPKQLAAKYGITVQEVDDVNDPEFLRREILDKNTVGGVSIRCYQTFSPETIEFMNRTLPGRDTGNPETNKGFLWNIHPGKLGKKDEEVEYRGIWTPLRVLLNEEPSNWWTLHEVAERLDTGRIIERTPRVINPEEPMMNIYTNYADVGAGMIMAHLQKYQEGELHVQNHARIVRGTLHSYPKAHELSDFLGAGYKIVDPYEYVDFCVKQFTDPRTKQGQRIAGLLKPRIEGALESWYHAHVGEYRAAYGQYGSEYGHDNLANNGDPSARAITPSSFNGGTPSNGRSPSDGSVGGSGNTPEASSPLRDIA